MGAMPGSTVWRATRRGDGFVRVRGTDFIANNRERVRRRFPRGRRRRHYMTGSPMDGNQREMTNRAVADQPAVQGDTADDETLQSRRRLRWSARLLGTSEIPPIATEANGTFRARLSADEREIEYELTYSNLSSDALFAHIHFGHPTDNGGILAFLCGGGDKPACPVRGGTVTGIIKAEDIQAIPEQGVAAGDFTTALRIIQAGLAYVNVHSETFPEGEIRGQLQPSRR